jgi:hypothetical protein
MNIEAIGKDWTEWWKNHRHSGFASKYDERLGHEVYRWNQVPQEAFTILRYRVEFEDQTGISTGLSQEKFNVFSAEERAKWRKDQQMADQAVRDFAKAHGGREVPTEEEFDATLQECVAKLKRSLGHKPDEEEGNPF